MAGGNHGPGTMPPSRGASTRYITSGNEYGWVMRSLLVRMHRWLADDQAPPASMYPRIANQELVPLAQVKYPKLAGVDPPARLHNVFRLDFGPEFRSRGIVAYEPPVLGSPFTVLVPQVDADGNEVAGVRTPQVAVPLAVHTGWNLRAPSIGSSEEMFSMVGSYFPFAKETVVKRYGNKAAYLGRVREAAKSLAAGGFLLDRDLAAVEAVSAREWDFVTSATSTSP